jgi:transposase
MRTVALDLGATKISYCEVKDSQVIERATVRDFDELVRWLGPNTRPARVAFEACREGWAVHDRLQAWGHEPLMLDTTRVRQLGIGQHRRKNDRIDAETMARALEIGRIPLAHVLSPHRRQLRLQLSVRRALVETRAQYVMTIRSLLRALSHKLAGCRTEDFCAKLREATLDEAARAMIAPLVVALEAITPQIKLVETKLEQLCAEEPVVKRLSTMRGVALIVAATYVSVIDDAGRFRGAHQVQAYLGLVPSEETSVQRKLGAITKQGNGLARAMLLQAAWCILRFAGDDPLTRWGKSVAERRGKKIAAVAVARRLAGLLWAMWRDGTTYDPNKLGQASAKGLAEHAQKRSAEAEHVRAISTPTGNRPPKGKTTKTRTSREVCQR